VIRDAAELRLPDPAKRFPDPARPFSGTANGFSDAARAFSFQIPSFSDPDFQKYLSENEFSKSANKCAKCKNARDSPNVAGTSCSNRVGTSGPVVRGFTPAADQWGATCCVTPSMLLVAESILMRCRMRSLLAILPFHTMITLVPRPSIQRAIPVRFQLS
jgi:hypothetical protein